MPALADARRLMRFVRLNSGRVYACGSAFFCGLNACAYCNYAGGVIFAHYVRICGYVLALFVRLYDFNAYRIAKKTARLISFFL